MANDGNNKRKIWCLVSRSVSRSRRAAHSHKSRAFQTVYTCRTVFTVREPKLTGGVYFRRKLASFAECVIDARAAQEAVKASERNSTKSRRAFSQHRGRGSSFISIVRRFSYVSHLLYVTAILIRGRRQSRVLYRTGSQLFSVRRAKKKKIKECRRFRNWSVKTSRGSAILKICVELSNIIMSYHGIALRVTGSFGSHVKSLSTAKLILLTHLKSQCRKFHMNSKFLFAYHVRPIVGGKEGGGGRRMKEIFEFGLTDLALPACFEDWLFSPRRNILFQ